MLLDNISVFFPKIHQLKQDFGIFAEAHRPQKGLILYLATRAKFKNCKFCIAQTFSQV